MFSHAEIKTTFMNFYYKNIGIKCNEEKKNDTHLLFKYMYNNKTSSRLAAKPLLLKQRFFAIFRKWFIQIANARSSSSNRN